MSFESLPNDLEVGVQKFAEERSLSHDEAVLRLIKRGLETDLVKPPIKGLTGIPMTDEEARIVDEALEVAMQSRRDRSSEIFRG